MVASLLSYFQGHITPSTVHSFYRLALVPLSFPSPYLNRLESKVTPHKTRSKCSHRSHLRVISYVSEWTCCSPPLTTFAMRFVVIPPVSVGRDFESGKAASPPRHQRFLRCGQAERGMWTRPARARKTVQLRNVFCKVYAPIQIRRQSANFEQRMWNKHADWRAIATEIFGW